MKGKFASIGAVALVLGMATLASCGDDDSSSEATAAPASQPSTGGASAGSTAASGSAAESSDCVTEATSRYEAAMAPMELGEISPLDVSSIKGKKFATIDLTHQSALSVVMAENTAKALQAVGAETTIYDGKGTPTVIAEAFQSAISQGVAGIVAIGLNPELVPQSIADAKSAGIPVILAVSNEPQDPLMDGIVANINADSVRIGALQADYALALTDCKLKAAVFLTSAGPVTVNHTKGAEEEIEELCGSDCSLEKVEFNAGTFVTTLAGQVQTTLQRSPDINFLMSTADILNPYILQGRNALGSEVPLGGAQGDTLAEAMKGDAQIVDIQWPPGEVIGWYFADSIMRAVLGEPENKELPIRVVDSTNWGTSMELAEQFPNLVDYRDQFKAAWGIS